MRLIDADALHEEICERMTRFRALGNYRAVQIYGFVASAIGDAPTADVEPVRNATIQQTTSDDYYGVWGVCPECGYEDNTVSAKYCGGCGARLIWRMNNDNCPSD